MRFIIYDIEVFAYDWLIVFKDTQTGERYIFHNDNEAVLDFMHDNKDAVFVGFNNKHYDNHIVKAIVSDFSSEELKQLNDYLIDYDGNGWDYPPLQQHRFWFNSSDIKDDTQDGLSLKAIEAHLGMDIEESEIDFKINRPLTSEELDKTVHYCSYDVDATETLFKCRSRYIQCKINLSKRCDITTEKALSLTNAGLTAKYLGAVKTTYTDGREYHYPEGLDVSLIPTEVLDFFNQLNDLSIADIDLLGGRDAQGRKHKGKSLVISIGGCSCTFGWGGGHGSLKSYHETATETRCIQNRDVSSLYPALLIEHNYISRSCTDRNKYKNTRDERLIAKRDGDAETAQTLKNPLNGTSGAMDAPFNDLYDPRNARGMRISGQLFLTMLIMRLLTGCKTLKLIQFNTDSVMYSVDKSELPLVDEICSQWEKESKFELETDDMQSVWVKDVNNTLFVTTSGKTKAVGSYLVHGITEKGAWNINNNHTIVKDAVINYFTKNIPVEETIENCNTPLSFQIVAKAGSKYGEVYHIVDGEKIKTQKVNRVYATRHREYGTLIKIHASRGGKSKIGGLPDHCIIDNRNTIDISDIDKSWYIRLAKKYIGDFLGVSRKGKRGNTRKINSIKKQILKILEVN